MFNLKQDKTVFWYALKRAVSLVLDWHNFFSRLRLDAIWWRFLIVAFFIFILLAGINPLDIIQAAIYPFRPNYETINFYIITANDARQD